MTDFVEFDAALGGPTPAFAPPPAPAEPVLPHLPDIEEVVTASPHTTVEVLRAVVAFSARHRRRRYEDEAKIQKWLATTLLEAILQIGEDEGERDDEADEELLLHALPILLSCDWARGRMPLGGGDRNDAEAWKPFYGYYASDNYHVWSWRSSVPGDIRAAPDVLERGDEIALRKGGAWILLATKDAVLKAAYSDPLWVVESIFHIPSAVTKVGYSVTEVTNVSVTMADKFIDI